MLKELSQNKKGFSVIEAVVGAAIFSLLAIFLVDTWRYGVNSNISGGNRVRATFLAEEGLEAARSIKDGAFANLANGSYGITLSGGKWIFSGINDTTDIFTRSTNISTVDTQTKLISTTIDWSEKGINKSVSLSEYLTDWTKRTIGNWANPILYGLFNATGNTDANHIEYKGDYAYIVRNGATPNFLTYNLTNPASPIAGTTLTLTGTINDMHISGNYLYLTSSNDSGELIVINISNPASPTVLTTYNMSGTSDGYAVYLSGNYAFVTRATGVDKEFTVLNVSNPAVPTVVGTVDTSSTAKDMVVLGNYAYLATINTTLELNVVNIANLASPVLLAGFNISGTNIANTIAGFGSTIFVGLDTGLVSVIDVTNPAALSSIATYTVGAGGSAVNAERLSPDGSLLFTGTSNSSMEFHVVDVSNIAAPVAYGLLNLNGNTWDLVYDPDKDLVYAASADNNRELTIIAPQ